MGGRLTLGREIGRNHHLFDFITGYSRNQPIQMNLSGPNTIKGRDPSHQYKVKPTPCVTLLHRKKIRRRFHHTQLAAVPSDIRTDLTQLLLGKGIAFPTMSDGLNRMQQRLPEQLGTRSIMLKKMQCHSLGGLWPHAGQTT